MPASKQRARGGDAGPLRILPALDDRREARSKTKAPKIQQASGGTALARYDSACRALAEAVAVDEVIAIRDEAAQIAAAARVANNHKAEADAVAIRMRATRRLGQLMQAQKESVGLATGGEHGGRRRIDGLRSDPSIQRPTLAMQGIGKHLAHQARVLSRPSDEVFEKTIADVHERVARAVRNGVREIEIEQEREAYRARTKEGGTVADLEALATGGFRAGVMVRIFPGSSKPGVAKASSAAPSAITKLGRLSASSLLRR